MDARKIGRVRIAEFSATEGDETGIFLLLWHVVSHSKNKVCKRIKLLRLLKLGDEDLKRADHQFARRFRRF
jgi:hypothetical protein